MYCSRKMRCFIAYVVSIRASLIGSNLSLIYRSSKPPPMQHSILEHALEEHPTEIFVRHEVPFNLPLVGSLLADIRSNLIERCDQEHMSNLKHALPDLKVRTSSNNNYPECVFNVVFMHTTSLVPTPTEDGPGIDCLRMRQPLVRF